MKGDANDNSNTRTLRVAEADSRDVGRRIARIDPKSAQKLGMSTGEALEISSEQRKKTAVLNWPAYQQDYGKGLIRMDGYTRNKLTYFEPVTTKKLTTLLLITA